MSLSDSHCPYMQTFEGEKDYGHIPGCVRKYMDCKDPKYKNIFKKEVSGFTYKDYQKDMRDKNIYQDILIKNGDDTYNEPAYLAIGVFIKITGIKKDTQFPTNMLKDRIHTSFFTAADLFALYQNFNTQSNIINILKTEDIIVIFDLGKESNYPSYPLLLQTILQMRNNRSLSTIIATALSDEEIKTRYSLEVYNIIKNYKKSFVNVNTTVNTISDDEFVSFDEARTIKKQNEIKAELNSNIKTIQNLTLEDILNKRIIDVLELLNEPATKANRMEIKRYIEEKFDVEYKLKQKDGKRVEVFVKKEGEIKC